MIGAFLYYRATGDRDWSPALAWVVAIGVPAAARASLTHVLVMARLRHASSLVRVVATLGVFFLAIAVANEVWGGPGHAGALAAADDAPGPLRRGHRGARGPAVAHRHRHRRHRRARRGVPLDPVRPRHRRRRREPGRRRRARLLAGPHRHRQLGRSAARSPPSPACSSRRSSSSASPPWPSPSCGAWPPRSSGRSARSGGPSPAPSASASSSRR